MRVIAAVAALLVTFSADGFAQAVATAAKPEQARPDAAEAYYAAADYETDIKIYVDAAVDQYAKAIALRGGKADVETERKLADLIRPDFQAAFGARHHIMVEYFAEHFSVEELTEIVSWLRTPVGIKLKATKPELLREVYAITGKDLQSLRSRLWATHRSDFERLGLSFAGVRQQ